MRVHEQTYEPVLIDTVSPHPDNPRRGDVGSIVASIDANGFYGAIVVQKSTGYILAGNHRWQAAKAAGMPSIPAVVLDVDDDRARRILLVDNRANDIATYDEAQLIHVLKTLEISDDALGGTGYTTTDLADLLAKSEPPDLDRMADELGDPVDTDTWPTITVKVPIPVAAAWRGHLRGHDGDGAAALADLLGVDVDQADA